MDPIGKLIDLFRQFPGIGPRQAKRFVYFLLSRNRAFVKELAVRMEALLHEISQCASCRRFFLRKKETFCALCTDPNRTEGELMVVASDVDLESVEKSGGFSGRYFVLGGTIHLLEKKPAEKIRTEELLSLAKAKAEAGTLKEIILALSANPDGEYTADDLRQRLAPLTPRYGIRITSLGRGLSTGSELEYADPLTLQNALKNRA